MMVGPGSTTPLARLDPQELGVLDHLSFGMPNMETAMTTLVARDRLSRATTVRQLYGLDGARVELMEFRP